MHAKLRIGNTSRHGAWLRCPREQEHHRHPYFARNLSRSFFETPQKRCNSNDANSMFEQAAGELRAKLMGGGGAWPRCRWVAAGPGRASRSTTPSAARVWRSRGRAAAHRHTQRPGPTKQPGPTDGPSGARNTSGATSSGLKDKKSWWRVSPSCFGGGLCGGGRARRWRRPIWG